ncbi:MAG: HlyD family efflux transporter periplasmic adaptor subunit [Clostridia bacterium]|nr:HlyD family efflux transporter periplasmic adaptor subunit [Clostridia bacterium]MBR6568473.1 HlyD family efflux transporter periplasmic adaptor subunit [Clostridia bacterium]
MKKIISFINKFPRKRVIAVCVSVVLVLLLSVMPMIAARRGKGEGAKASILSGKVEKGDISTVLISGGTLSQQEGEKINIPSSVKLKEYLVSNGDKVNKNDDLAVVDRVTLMKAISDVQETMDYLRKEMENAKGESSMDRITAQRTGTVKAVYAKKGDDVQSVMLEKGALAVISLDGLMSVELETDKDISAGEKVKIIFKDKTEVSGQVKTYLDGVAKIVFEDENYTEGTKVTVTKEDGTKIGSGKTQINSRWNATAYSGTVSSVKVSEKEEVSSGEALFTLENVSSTAKYDNLASQHRNYEELMLSLFEMYQSGTLKAPSDGTVSGIEKDSTLLLSNAEGVSIELLANSPDGNDEISYNNYIGKIILANDGIWNVNLNPENQVVTDYKNLLEVDFAEEKMTQNGNFNPTVPVYELDINGWKQIEANEVQPGDVLLFAGADTSDIKWAVRIIKGSILSPETTTEPSTAETTTTVPTTTEPSTTVPSTTQPPVSSTKPSGNITMPSGGDFTMPSGDITMPSGGDFTMPSGDITMPSGGDFTMPSGDITMPSGGDFSVPSGGNITMPSGGDFTLPSGQNQIPGGFFGGSFGGDLSGLQYGLIQNENKFELFDLEGTTVLSVIPGDTMTVTVSVDEIDLHKIEAGMKAEVTLDAFIGESFDGVISDIGTNGKNSGGNSKFSVEITMDKAENMLVGMNATAKIILASQKDVLTVPVEALCDIGNETVIYTRYDKSDDTLKKPVTVTVGASDGKIAQILSGLDEGDEYYYSYYDEYQESEDSSGFGGMGGFGR